MMRRDPFQAIADPNRRAILALIARESMNLNTVASHFKVSRPAISKHIKILRQCGLVEIRQKGRERYCEARLERLSEVVLWLEDYRSQWSTEIDTAPVSKPAEPAPAPIAEITVDAEQAAKAASVAAATVTAMEVEASQVNLDREVVEEYQASVVDVEAPATEISEVSEITVVKVADEVTTDAPAAGVAVKTGLVPWEEGYDETADALVEDTTEEVSLSADAVAAESPTVSVVSTEEVQEDEISMTPQPVPQPEPEITPPVPATTGTKPSRKKKSPPPADTLQGSLF